MSEAKEIEADFLEKTLLEPMSKLKSKEMDEDQTNMMISVMMAEKNNKIDLMYEELKKSIWALKAVEKRVEVSLTADIDKATQIMIVLLLEGNIGRCVIYLYYIQWWAKQNNQRKVTFSDFTQNIFPWGFPSADDILPLWNAQKAKRGNYIDAPEASESIQFKTQQA
jgi:hypothetical protein